MRRWPHGEILCQPVRWSGSAWDRSRGSNRRRAYSQLRLVGPEPIRLEREFNTDDIEQRHQRPLHRPRRRRCGRMLARECERSLSNRGNRARTGTAQPGARQHARQM